LAVFFFAIVGAMAVTGLLVYDMDRNRRRMGAILARLELLAEGSKKFRTQHLRRLSLSIFSNSQLMDSLEREIGLMEREFEIESAEDSSPRSLLSSKQLQALEGRVETLEVHRQARDQAKAQEQERESVPAEDVEKEANDGAETPDNRGEQDSQPTTRVTCPPGLCPVL